MKETGIQWIGKIPDNWVLDRLQWHLDEVKESNNPIQTKEVLSLTNKGMHRHTFIFFVFFTLSLDKQV